MGVVLVKGGNSTASSRPPATTPVATTAASVVAPPLPSATLAPVASTAPAVTHQVLVSVLPADATITRDGVDLGSSPVALSLADGTIAGLVVSKKGYATKNVPVDSSQPKVAIKLDPMMGPAAVGAGPAPKPKGGGGGGIDDVGDPFAKH
jgi:hypothetical protein